MEGAKRSLVRFSERYQDNLKIETDVLDRMQKSIEDQMREADSLAIRALNATNERTNRIDNDMKALRQGRRWDFASTLNALTDSSRRCG